MLEILWRVLWSGVWIKRSDLRAGLLKFDEAAALQLVGEIAA